MSAIILLAETGSDITPELSSALNIYINLYGEEGLYAMLEDEEAAAVQQTPESEIVEITIFDNFADPVLPVSETTAALSGGKTNGSIGLWAAAAALLAAALAIGILLRRRGRKSSRT